MTTISAEPPLTGSSEEVRTWLITNPAEMEEVYAIRQEVFVDEQGLIGNVRNDPDDRYSYHVLGAVGDEVAGCGRVTFFGDEAQVVWVAVRKPLRRYGVGGAIMRHLIRLADEQGCRIMSLNAQTHALNFYRELGFVPVGRVFMMSHIEHQAMVREIGAS